MVFCCPCDNDGMLQRGLCPLSHSPSQAPSCSSGPQPYSSFNSSYTCSLTPGPLPMLLPQPGPLSWPPPSPKLTFSHLAILAEAACPQHSCRSSPRVCSLLHTTHHSGDWTSTCWTDYLVKGTVAAFAHC